VTNPPVHVVRTGELSSQTSQTSGLLRLEALSARTGASSLWGGISELAPGARTGIHHHGSAETIVYVLSGRGRWTLPDQNEPGYEAGPGDFVLIPPFVAHREENTSADVPVVMVVVRTEAQANVVNLDPQS